MAAPVSESLRLSPLSPTPPARPSLDYAALRESGMRKIRELAAATWTDHNVHDPGITLLEAFCYAMTELGFRIQLDVADLLRSGEAHAPAALVPAHRVLPAAPVTPDDLRRLLLDNPLVADALINLDSEGEVRFYEDPLADPPFSYNPGGPPPLPLARPRGLFEVMTAFATAGVDLDSNAYEAQVDFKGVTYTLDIALPHWDEKEVAPFRAGATATTVTMIDPGVGVWRRLDEPLSFFGTLRVDHKAPAGTVELWIVLRVVDDLEQPGDVIDGILAAARTLVETTGADSLIDQFSRRVRAAQATADQISHYLAFRRNLCEEPVRLAAARVQEIAVAARLEVTGGTDLEALLAEVFLAIDRELSPPVLFHSLAEMRARGRSVEEIFDGPLLRQGFLDRDELAGLSRPTVLYTSDVLRLIMRRRTAAGSDLVAQENPSGRDIVAVTDLRLSNFVNNRPMTTDARDCLRLVETDRYRPQLSLAKSRVVLVRDDVEVAYDRQRVEQLFEDGRQGTALPADPSPVLPVPAGEALPIEDYTPFQNDLPRIYGLGEAGLPANAGVERRAQTLQAKGYLHLFEQFLADSTAQLGNVNRLFSPDPNETATYFTRPLFDLPGVAEILARFPPGGNWQAFVADPANPHRRALQEAAEDRDRFLDRRNRMLDHLLARLGEETVALGQELHRQARSELAAASLTPAVLAARRQAVNARLIQAKAAFLAEAPELAASRLQAFGTPLQRQPGMLKVERDGAAFRWTLAPDGPPLLRSLASPPLATAAVAQIAAEEAMMLAGQPTFYAIVTVGSRRRYQLRDSSAAGARVVGESAADFATVGEAQTAANATAARFAALWVELSLSPMERRIRHLTGIRAGVRRRLLLPDQFFEIVDTTAGDGIVNGWRLRDQPAPAGAVFLASVSSFTAANDAAALALARLAIGDAARYGLDEWSYDISPAGSAFAVELRDPAGNPIARPPGTFPSVEQARQAVAAIIALLHQHYGAEGFHLVEHLLLRPRQTGDTFLSMPAETGKERDPYSQRLSLIFPSGWARNFSQADAVRQPAAPHRFRDPELRRHAERMVRQACPAHLLPTIFWVDRDLAPAPQSAASFDGFEARYFTWLDTLLVPGRPPADVRTARNNLAAALNAIAKG
jgi:hypothetical protein